MSTWEGATVDPFPASQTRNDVNVGESVKVPVDALNAMDESDLLANPCSGDLDPMADRAASGASSAGCPEALNIGFGGMDM